MRCRGGGLRRSRRGCLVRVARGSSKRNGGQLVHPALVRMVLVPLHVVAAVARIRASISHARHTFWCGAWRRWQCAVHHARARRAFLRRSGPWRKIREVMATHDGAPLQRLVRSRCCLCIARSRGRSVSLWLCDVRPLVGGYAGLWCERH
eukprot:scaffold11431_cov118-Isochrysis_galbana.AAC.16